MRLILQYYFCAVNLWINAKLQEGDIENGGMGDNLCGWYDDRGSYAGFAGGFFYGAYATER